MYLIPRYIQLDGLDTFVLDGFEEDINIDSGAISHILENLSQLTTLRIRNMNKIEKESLENLIETTCDLIRVSPPKLIILDLSGIGGTTEQGVMLLEAMHDTQMLIK